MAKVIDDVSAVIRERLGELDAERKRLESALSELGGTARKRRGPKPGGKRKASTNGRRRRKGGKRTGPTRKEQVLDQAKNNPTAKTSEIARTLGVKPNQVSNLLTTLKKEGALKKDGRSGKWVISESTSK